MKHLSLTIECIGLGKIVNESSSSRFSYGIKEQSIVECFKCERWLWTFLGNDDDDDDDDDGDDDGDDDDDDDDINNNNNNNNNNNE